MDLIEVTDKINRLSEELEKLRPLKPEDELRVMQKFRLDWNYNSNKIEGNSYTFHETKALILSDLTADGKPAADYKQIIGHNEAINKIIEFTKNKEPLTEAFIRNLHILILPEPYHGRAKTSDGKPTTKLIEIGRYKRTPNHVETVTGEMFYFTSPEATPVEMGELMKWYRNNINNNEIDPLIFAVEFHHRFIRIHPFDDGNGRIVRLLMNLLLMQKGFPPIIIKVKDKDEYYRVLNQADGGNLKPFYIFIGVQLIRSLELKISAAKGKEIEESDDVDKEIALLKRELVKEEEKKEKKNIDNVKHIIEFYSHYFIDKIIPSLKNIADFYFQDEIHVVFNNNIWGEVTKNEFSDKIKIAIENLKNVDNFRELNLYYKLNDFLKPIDVSFNDGFDLIIIFTLTSYSFQISKVNFNKSILYHKLLNEEELEQIIKDLKKVFLKYIKQKLNRK